VRTADGKGRACALEIAIVNFGMANLIREGKTFQLASAIQGGRAEGMQTMEQALAELVEQGRITREAAYATAINKEYMATLVGMPPPNQ
jgi:twitching motility protein PilT